MANLLLLLPCSRLVASKSIGPSAVTLLSNGELDTLTLGQRDPWLLTANDAECTLAKILHLQGLLRHT
jgi:hypothetical protein